MTNGADDALTSDGLTVGATATLVGVTVRALHHWDALGLVRPSERSLAGYRLYSASDVARIHRVLIYRELGLPLEDIGALLDDPATNATGSLQHQRAQLVERVSHLQQMIMAMDRMIEATTSGVLLSAEEQVAIFGGDWQPGWAAGARDRWGHTAQWTQYAERAAQRTADDWREIAENVAKLHDDLATAKVAGVRPGSAEGNALAERHRDSLGVYFDCTLSMQVCLGRMYVDDPEFAAAYDKIEPGLTSWLRDIIQANARGQGIDPQTATWI